MQAALEFLKQHGYPALFCIVLADQLGVPLPSVPMLLGAGALVGLGYMAPLPVAVAVLLATLLGDLVWYELGRHQGARVLRVLCRVSIEPDSCVRATEGVFARYGQRVLLFSKFVPGLYTVTPPVAGMIGLPRWRFLALDAVGTFLWLAVYAGLGCALSEQLEWLLMSLEGLGATLAQIIGAILVLHLTSKLVLRWLFLRRLRTARITPEQLKAWIDEGAEPWIADLRHRLDIERDPAIIPGAVLLPVDDLDLRHLELPRDRDIVLYCS